MVSFDPKIKEYGNPFTSANKVGGVNPFVASEKPSFKGGEVGAVPANGWEAYHTGQGPNGLNGGFLSDGTGENGKHKLNIYL